MSHYDFCRDVWTSFELSCIIIICQTKTLYTWSLRLALFSDKIEHEYRPQADKDIQPTKE